MTEFGQPDSDIPVIETRGRKQTEAQLVALAQGIELFKAGSKSALGAARIIRPDYWPGLNVNEKQKQDQERYLARIIREKSKL